MSSKTLKEEGKDKIPAVAVGVDCGESIATSATVSISKVKPGECIQKSISSLETPPSSPPSNSLLGFTGSFLSRTFGRQRTVSEGGVSVSVDLSPWLKDGDNIREVREARVRRNSTREVEEAMAAGLTKADIHMPPI